MLALRDRDDLLSLGEVESAVPFCVTDDNSGSLWNTIPEPAIILQGARANIREAMELYLAPGGIDLPEDAKLFEVTVG